MQDSIRELVADGAEDLRRSQHDIVESVSALYMANYPQLRLLMGSRGADVLPFNDDTEQRKPVHPIGPRLPLIAAPLLLAHPRTIKYALRHPDNIRTVLPRSIRALD